MSFSVDRSAMTPAFQTASEMQQGIAKDGGKSFSQDFAVGDKKFTVTLNYPKGREVSPETAQKDMEGKVGKMLTLATELGLGDNGLEKIKMNDNQVIGKWRGEDGKSVKHNVIDKLKQERAEAAGNPEKLMQIDKKLANLGKVSNVFSSILPLSVGSKTSTGVVSELTATTPHESVNQGGDAKAVKAFEKEFYTAYNSALTHATELEGEDKAKLSLLLTKYTVASEKLDKLVADGNASPEEIKALREEIGKYSLELKKGFDSSQEKIFANLEQNLTAMTHVYNTVVDERKALEAGNRPEDKPRIKQLKALEEKMEAKIREGNAVIGHTALSTNGFTATKSHVIAFGAVLEKKMELLERKSELEASGKTGRQLKKINKELAKAPSSETLSKSAAEIQTKLTKSAIHIVSQQEAKALNRAHGELAWGASHVNMALTTPANWTEVKTALVKFSRSGRAHTAVSVLKPLNISDKGGVPAGLRSHDKFDQRTANLIMTTTYVLGSEGQKSGENVSFRGGQFPTPESAKEAIEAIIRHLPPGQSLEFLHINALLTPTAMTAIKKDKLLLSAHKKSVMEALDMLVQEARGPNKAKFASLKENIGLSNHGVNEGAVGELKFLGMRIQLGWHTSMADYTNDASQKLNKAVFGKLESMREKAGGDDLAAITGDLDRLGAMLHVGQEMEAVFANNDYSDARVGDNQFKLPSLWKVMDSLVGVPCYTDCMSGKDRTGKVESNAHEYLDEITMNIADHKLELGKEFQGLKGGLDGEKLEAWTGQEKVLTAACFKKEELGKFHRTLQEKGVEAFKKELTDAVQEKISDVRKGLGMEVDSKGFMEEKKNIPRSVFKAGVDGIPTNEPKMKKFGDLKTKFPDVAVSSMYGREPIDFTKLSPKEMAKMEGKLSDRQREAVNRRLSQLSGSMQVTQINTGKPGFKLDVGEPLAKFSSGFDREFVLYKLLTANAFSPNFFSDLDKWTGLHELDSDSRGKYQEEFHSIAHNQSLSMEKKIEGWTKVLREIEEDKMQTMVPKAKVKA
ncbi:hypothetical protein [Estrella lausannensis]|uniref:Uncharacterized protein n=1 Tax=Estrella lausannensis TaxID=483423 RepID=A0A0H5DNW8_9BACT|nr:hypothetical protein [Estrella lausannensis]CRX38017.1 hypothetical protein ELAC_0665 [Estrella lausannensis]